MKMTYLISTEQQIQNIKPSTNSRHSNAEKVKLSSILFNRLPYMTNWISNEKPSQQILHAIQYSVTRRIESKQEKKKKNQF